MPSSGLSGPYNLTNMGIDAVATRVAAGAYILGKTEEGLFKVHYAGRSDDDVIAKLKEHVNEWYPKFKFDYFPSATAAFEKQCDLYHDFNPPDNKVHPDRPMNSNVKC